MIITASQFKTDAKTKSGRPGKKCGNSYIAATAVCNNGREPVKKGSGGSTKKYKPPYRSKRVKAVGRLLGGLTGVEGVAQIAESAASFKKGLSPLAVGQAIAGVGKLKAAQQFSQGRIGRGFATSLGTTAIGLGASSGLVVGNVYAGTPGAKRAARSAGEAAGRAWGATGGRAKEAAFNIEQRMRGFRKMKRPTSTGLAIRDSVWADGFQP